VFVRVFFLITLFMLLFAPWLIRALAPGLDANYVGTAVALLRIVSLSSLAAGVAALHSAFLFTHRMFAPTAFYQALLNVFSILGAVSLWRVLGVYGFAIGFSVGAWAHLAIVWFGDSRRLVARVKERREGIGWARQAYSFKNAQCWGRDANLGASYNERFVPHKTVFHASQRTRGMRVKRVSSTRNGIHHQRRSGVSRRIRFQ